MVKTVFLYTDDLGRFDYGEEHPLKPWRLTMTYDLIQACGLFSREGMRIIEPEMASEEDLLLFHEKEYLDVLNALDTGIVLPDARRYGLGPGDNPPLQGIYRWSRLVAGASLKAAALVQSGEADIAFNIAGGLHHARSSRASGFCYINDPVIAIEFLLRRGCRVAYIDIDAHHGDGVQDAFFDTDRVLTISLHENGDFLFPGTGYVSETGTGAGSGYAVNIPLPPYTGDNLYLSAFREIVPDLIGRFRPDVVVSQLGVDTFATDPLAHLNLTNNAFASLVAAIKEIAPRWVALGGGGYDVTNVAKAWTLAWAVMNGLDVPDEIPREFLLKYPLQGFGQGKLRDRALPEEASPAATLRNEIEEVVRVIKETVAPKIGSPGRKQ